MRDFYHSNRIHRTALLHRAGYFLFVGFAVACMIGCAVLLAYSLAAQN